MVTGQLRAFLRPAYNSQIILWPLYFIYRPITIQRGLLTIYCVSPMAIAREDFDYSFRWIVVYSFYLSNSKSPQIPSWNNNNNNPALPTRLWSTAVGQRIGHFQCPVCSREGLVGPAVTSPGGPWSSLPVALWIKCLMKLMFENH